ncbi:MAG: heme ABC transporter permease CcmC [Burkholderiaceae bacterium]|jgi:heme exporter protein C|nr:heme ABC transporter permease CcmC [Burkholderiaceae bacterium]
MNLSKFFFWFAAPARFLPLAGALVRPLQILALLTGAAGLFLGFGVAPADANQGEGYRIIYLHVPASWVAMFAYALMAFWSFVGLVWRTRLSHLLSHALAPTGAVFAALSLITGALWGQPMWGAWWVWDARLTSSLLLLLLFLGYLALLGAIDDPQRADRACAVLALLGALNLPVMYFSVRWWNTLHQGATIKSSGASMAPVMLTALLLCCVAAWTWAAATVLRRVQLLIFEREAHTRWLRAMQDDAPADAPASAPTDPAL